MEQPNGDQVAQLFEVRQLHEHILIQRGLSLSFSDITGRTCLWTPLILPISSWPSCSGHIGGLTCRERIRRRMGIVDETTLLRREKKILGCTRLPKNPNQNDKAKPPDARIRYGVLRTPLPHLNILKRIFSERSAILHGDEKPQAEPVTSFSREETRKRAPSCRKELERRDSRSSPRRIWF